ncbi:MAG TPA: hypothetical protein VIE63_17225 [Ramlibacter sp.]|jgi:hypothetical protein
MRLFRREVDSGKVVWATASSDCDAGGRLIARRIAESLWYGNQVGRQPGALPQAP